RVVVELTDRFHHPPAGLGPHVRVPADGPGGRRQADGRSFRDLSQVSPNGDLHPRTASRCIPFFNPMGFIPATELKFCETEKQNISATFLSGRRRRRSQVPYQVEAQSFR